MVAILLGKHLKRKRTTTSALACCYCCCWLVLFSSSTTAVRAMATVNNNHISSNNNMQPKIAVIGAGASGLATARILSRNKVTPTVFEKQPEVGGVWKYSPNAKDKPMYRGLRTNLPKEIMAFREYPFPSNLPSFVTHQNVQEYLQSYRDHYGLNPMIRYATTVEQLSVLPDTKSCFSPSSPKAESWPKIKLQWKHHSATTGGDGDSSLQEDVFDGVFICNGHYATPTIPDLPGLDSFTGTTMHSIEYDSPKDFANQRVLCIGGRASGSDLAREISTRAKHVYLSDTTCEKEETCDNVTWVPKTMQMLPDNCVAFENCALTPQVDVVVFCSGYEYSFPFINQQINLELSVGDRRVMPLYRQLWHAKFPNLVFVGIPHSVVPFPLFEFQVEAVWNQWNASDLPDADVRMAEARKDATKASRPQDTHFLGSEQWDYCRDLSKLSGQYNDLTENFIATNKAIYDHAGNARKSLFPGGPDTYRELNYDRLDDSECGFQVFDKAREEIIL